MGKKLNKEEILEVNDTPVSENEEQVNKADFTNSNENDLLNRLKQQEEMLNKLMAQLATVQATPQVQPTTVINEAPKIEKRKYIKIVSLTLGVLNLKGRNMQPVTFSHYGQVRSFTEDIVREIIDNNQTFLEKGKFYICDDELLYELSLLEVYEHVLSFEQINTILESSDMNEVIGLYNQANESQKTMIAEKIVKKVADGSYNATIIDKFEKETGLEIRKKAEEAISYREIYQEDEKELERLRKEAELGR